MTCAPFRFLGKNNRPRWEIEIMKTIRRIIMAGVLALALTTSVFAQINTNLQFAAVAVTTAVSKYISR
jgi:hypothetical protein